MSRVVVGYRDGKAVYFDEGPSRGRVSKYGQGNLHSLTLIGGDLVTGEPGAAEKHRQQVAAHKAKR